MDDVALDRTVADRPNVLAVIPGLIPSTEITVVRPLTALHRDRRLRVAFAYESHVPSRMIDRADVIVFSRTIEPQYRHTLDAALHRGTPHIYDLDDNFFNIPTGLEAGAYIRDESRQQTLRDYVASAARVRVYSEGTAAFTRPINDRTEVVWAPADTSLVRRPGRRSDGRIRIVYPTSHTENVASPAFTRAIARLVEDDENLEMHWWGNHYGFLGRERHHFHPYVAPYEKFVRRFSAAGFDVGVAPTRSGPFYASKTNNKYREFGASRVAGVYSNEAVFTSCVQEGRTGLLVDDDEGEWWNAIRRLIQDESLRRSIAEAAFDHVSRAYSPREFREIWVSHITTALSQRQAPKPVAMTERAKLRTVVSGSVKAGNLVGAAKRAFRLTSARSRLWRPMARV